jgi:putative ATPase
VYILKSLDEEELHSLLERAIKIDVDYKEKNIIIEETEALFRYSGGDARKLLNILDIIVSSQPDDEVLINNTIVTNRLQENIARYDKSGEQHYDIISAFIKSIRGSDPNAAVYWLARMIEGGEDPKFIARRLIILASEDIGLANPNALLLATTCFQAVQMIGWPESKIILSQTAIYLATSPKSNSAYMAINQAEALVKESGDLSVPLHLRNAPTKLMKQLGYGKDYKYSHSYANNFVDQEFLPEELSGTTLYSPQDNRKEKEIDTLMDKLWGMKYKNE